VLCKNVPDGLKKLCGFFFKTCSPCMKTSFELSDHWVSGWSEPQIAKRYRDQIEKLSIQDALQLPVVRNNLSALDKSGLITANLLDFGCAGGIYKTILSNYPRTKDWKYTGADVNTELIKLCREFNPGCRFESLEKDKPLPFKDKEFDISLLSGILQYAENYSFVLNEVKRITGKYIVARGKQATYYEKSSSSNCNPACQT